MIEVEIKLPVYRRSITEKELSRIGFIPGDLIRESDIYFTSDFHDFMKQDEALRIRTSENLTKGTASCVLTFKGPKIDSVSMTRKELETGVENADICRDILLSLGYQTLAPVKKLRQYYHLDIQSGQEQNKNLRFHTCADQNDIHSSCIHACVDQVEHLGSFLELEILVEKEASRPYALKKIEAILDDLGYSMADTTRYSYLCMLQNKTRPSHYRQ